MKLIKILTENDSEKIYQGLTKVVPEFADIKDFATAVGKMVVEDYGSHNIQTFLNVVERFLMDSLNEQEGSSLIQYEKESQKLQKELEDTYNRNDIRVRIYQFRNDDKVKGYVRFDSRELPPAEWKNIKNMLQAKGYEITKDSNYWDMEDDRTHYPTIEFEFVAQR
jgi:hypothetical protein